MLKVFLFLFAVTGLILVQGCKVKGLQQAKVASNSSGTPLVSKAVAENLVQLASLVSDWLFPTPAIPEVDENILWGDESQDDSIRPFQIKFSSERIQKLLEKLDNRENFTAPLIDSRFNYGINTDYLKTFLDYWRHQYDFKAREDRLNQFPQYLTNVQGLDIHFYHIKPNVSNKRVVPLLMLHGWPVSNADFLYVYPKLTEERQEYDYVFEVIAPTLPGFGYSQGTSKIGLSSYQIAIILKNFMKRLGYNQFFIHAGDFGQSVANDMQILYQDDILGFHSNFPFIIVPKTLAKLVVGSLNPTAVFEAKYVNRLYPFSDFAYFIILESGYFHIHATKPDTLGVALQDSPSGLAAWILTLMSWTSNPSFDNQTDGGLPQTFDINDLIDILTIIWDSESIVTSIRLYAEFSAWFQDPKQAAITINPTKVPYSCIKFLHEIIYLSDELLMDKYPKLVHSTTLDEGGHFAALENPQILADDIWVAVKKMEEFNERS